MTDKQIIVTFSDGYCIVLEDNKVSIRENEFTKLCIVVGNRTNELLEFVKNIYLDNKRKEQECEELEKELRQKKMTILMNNDHYLNVDQENKKLKQTLTEIKEIAEDESYIGFWDEQISEILQKIHGVEKCKQ